MKKLKSNEVIIQKRGPQIDTFIWGLILIITLIISWPILFSGEDIFLSFIICLLIISTIFFFAHSLFFGRKVIINDNLFKYHRFTWKIEIPLNTIEEKEIQKNKMGYIKLKIRSNQRNLFLDNMKDFQEKELERIFKVLNEKME